MTKNQYPSQPEIKCAVNQLKKFKFVRRPSGTLCYLSGCKAATRIYHQGDHNGLVNHRKRKHPHIPVSFLSFPNTHMNTLISRLRASYLSHKKLSLSRSFHAVSRKRNVPPVAREIDFKYRVESLKSRLPSLSASHSLCMFI